MRAVIQRVHNASVAVNGEVVGDIGAGLVIMVAVRQGDTDADARFLANKCVNMRIFSGEDGRFEL